MEEKERYSFEYADDGFDINDDELVYIFDNKNNKDIIICAYMDYKQGKDLCDLLNQLDKQNQKLCQQIVDLNKENNKLREFRDDILRVYAEPYRFYKEIQQLQQSQKQLAIEEFEKLLSKLSNIENTLINCGNGKEDAICWFVRLINDQIKELKGEE